MDQSDSIDNLAGFFELDKIVRWILANEFKRVALQLPDQYLHCSVELITELERRLTTESDKTDRKLYILADTSYRSCCLDEIAAEHATCDSIVHFGDACLSASGSRLPAFYVFCRRPIDLVHLEAKLGEQLTASLHHEAFLLCEAGYAHIQDSLERIIVSLLPSTTKLHSFKVADNSNSTAAAECQLLGRVAPEGFEPEKADQQQRLLIFVGAPDSPLLPLFQMTLKYLQKVVNYCPETRQTQTLETSTNKMLMKRLYLIERLRDARTVGLVVGSVGIKGCREAIARVRTLCKSAGKKLYVIYIGKMNEAKLSNFGLEVDAFILLSCPFGIILDGNKFCRPILSIFEAEIALNSERANNWLADMKWMASFQHLAKDEIGSPLKQGDSDSPDMSLTSGNIRLRLRDGEGNPADIADGRGQLIEYSAGDYFAMRSWRGLEDNSNSCDKCSCEVKEGFDGIATRYDKESTTATVDK